MQRYYIWKSHFRFFPLFSAFRLICKCRIKTKKLYISLKISNFVIDKKNLQIYENKERDCNTIFPQYHREVGIRETYFMDKQLQTVSQETIKNWLQNWHAHAHRPTNRYDLRLLRRALGAEKQHIFFYFYLLIFYSSAHIVNLLTNEIQARKSVRKYAILAHSATLWPSEHCKTGEKLTVFFRPKSTEKRPKSIDIEWWKHGYCMVIT